MGFIQDLEKELEHIYKNTGAPYNLAAFSYKHLKEVLTSRGIQIDVFIAELIQFSNDDAILKGNYLDVWRIIMKEVRDVLNNSAAGNGRKEQYCFIPDTIRTALKKLKPIPYKENGSRIDEKYNDKVNVIRQDDKKYLSEDIVEEMAAYYVIKAVGAFANEKENDIRFKAISSSNQLEGAPEKDESEDDEYDEPLNSFYQESVKIFRRASTENVWEFNWGEVPIKRHDTSTNLGINKPDISGILLFDLPDNNINIKSVSSDKGIIKRGSGETATVELTIMEVPFIGERDVTIFDKLSGSAFSVRHVEDYEVKAKALIEKYMYLAMYYKVNIVLFPEYMITKRIIKHLKSFLSKHYRRMENLLFVVAGSGWDDNNNISRIINFDGEQLAVTYKSNSYTGYNSKSGEWHESLKNPGKIIQVLDYKGIGRISNLICRDVFDESHNSAVNIISDLLEPNFFFIPAWSKSIETAFCEGCIKLAKHGAVSVTANCCEPILIQNHEIKTEEGVIDDRRKQRGICAFPSAEKIYGQINPAAYYVNCAKGNIDQCPHKHCAFIMTLEFSKKSFESGNFVKKNSLKHIALDRIVFDEDNQIKGVDNNAVLSSIELQKISNP